MAKKKKDTHMSEEPPVTAQEQAVTGGAPGAPVPGLPVLLDYSLPEQDAMSSQVTAAWTQLLALATSQGASRRDIVLMTLATAHGVLKITGENLWPPNTDLPPDELHGFGTYQGAFHATGQALQVLGNPPNLEEVN